MRIAQQHARTHTGGGSFAPTGTKKSRARNIERALRGIGGVASNGVVGGSSGRQQQSCHRIWHTATQPTPAGSRRQRQQRLAPVDGRLAQLDSTRPNCGICSSDGRMSALQRPQPRTADSAATTTEANGTANALLSAMQWYPKSRQYQSASACLERAFRADQKNMSAWRTESPCRPRKKSTLTTNFCGPPGTISHL